MQLHTPLCDLLSIDVPVLQAGMGQAHGTPTSPELVAAVSEAGGLGCVGAAGLDPDELSGYLTKIQSLTSRPFGVDLLVPADNGGAGASRGEIRRELAESYPRHAAFARALFERHGLAPAQLERTYAIGPQLAARQLEVVLDHRVPVIVLGLGDATPIVPRAHAAGAKVMAIAGMPSHAVKHAQRGADAVIAQGGEAGGHTGAFATFPLVPAVADAVSPLPVVAAGGIADGRGLVAALALGAQAVWCGTLFLYATEADIAPEQRRQLEEAGPRDLAVSKWYTGKPSRIVRTPVLDDWAASGLEPLPWALQHVLMDDFVEAARRAGRWELVNNPAGQIAATMTESRPAAQIVADMVSQAQHVLDHLR